jgi:uncharacterized protein YhaN
MILERCQILGFGKLRECSLDFQSGLNIVFAANEGGKSTLQRFLVASLYGQLRSDLRVQRRPDLWVEQYKPWCGSEYGGILWCRLSDGRRLEIHRSFGKEESRIEIRTSTGEDITKQYEQQRNGEVLFARYHLGLPKELFESVGIIRENRVAEIQSHETIRDRIANLAHSGDEELSIRQSLAKIQEMLDSIGSDRAPTKPYKQAMDLIENLQKERKALDERRSQFRDWIEDRNRGGGEIAGLERELSRTQKALAMARRQELACKVQSLEEINRDISALRAEIESLGAHPDFPMEKLEEINQLVGARDNILKQLGETRSEKDSALAQLARAESERQEVAAYASFATSVEAEKITEWFVSYLNLSLQKDGAQKSLARLQQDLEVLEGRLGALSPALKNPDIDWQRLAREAAEEEQNAARNGAELAQRIAQEKASLSASARAALGRRILGGALLVLAVAPTALRFLARFIIFSPIMEAALGSGFAILALILFFAAYRSARARRYSSQAVCEMEAQKISIQEEGGKKRKKFNEVMEASGFQSVNDFLALARQSEQDRQKLVDLVGRVAESEQQRDRYQAQSDEVYQCLKEGLAKVGLSCSPGNLKFQIDILRVNMRRFRDLDSHYSRCVQRADSLKSDESDLVDDYNLKCSLIQSLLNQAQVETPERFREECFKRQRLMELLEKEASRTREYQRLLGSFTLEQWKERLKEMMEQQDAQGVATNPAAASLETSSGAGYLPYLPTIAEAEETERRLSAKLAGAREEYARSVERTSQAFQNCRPSSDIDEDLAMAEAEFRSLERNRIALSTALETIEKLSRQQQEVLAPQLNAAVEQRFLRLCAGKYEEVKIDPDFQVWVREINSGELRLAEHLSRGTQDQLYFAMRFGVLDLVSNGDETCPSFLDEPFSAYDNTRLSEALKILAEEAERRQLILFTCREDLLDLATRHNAAVIALSS